jgi:dephospho-CoA kinase
MSGTGKSTLIQELRRRGLVAYDADDDGFSEPRGSGRWGWRRDLVADLLGAHTEGLLFFAGCSEEQAYLPFDLRVLLTAPEALLVSRLCARTGNAYGRTNAELVQVLSDRAEVEPVLRRAADLVLTSTAPPAELADAILARIADLGREHSN